LLRVHEVSFEAHGNRSTKGILLAPTSNPETTGIVVAHGAGNDMNAPLLSAFAEGLARSGFPTFRFNFLYRQEGGRTPDREEVLSGTWVSACKYLLESSGLDIRNLVAAGKSLGGRIAAQATAAGLLPVRRLIFLGYPLHPPGSPEKRKTASLNSVRVPMLFFAGTRDPLCDLDTLKVVLGSLHTDWELSVIEGGDHSFHLPKSMGVDEAEIAGRIVEKTVEWLRG